jgi:hypothetical protein
MNNRFQEARVIVSYYDHPLLDELYPKERWTKIAIGNGKKSLGNAAASRASKEGKEVILINQAPAGPDEHGVMKYLNRRCELV